MRYRVLVLLLVVSRIASADDVGPRAVVGLRVEGDSKVTATTALRLAHVAIGDPIDDSMIPRLEQALLTSNLFRSATVRLEEAPGGAVVVAALDDKLSWVVAPTLYLLPSSWSVGAGYAENDLFGEEKKLLLYGQLGNRTSMLFATYFDPAVRGSKLQLRLDVYLLRRSIVEYANPQGDARDYTIARTTTWNFLDAGVLVGWRWRWWLVGDVRFKPAYSFFTELEAGDPADRVEPDRDGRDVSAQTRLTIDRRKNRHGVTWGPYAQVSSDLSIPGLDDYGYQVLAGRAYYSVKFFAEHQLELRIGGAIGRHLPVHEELTLGGVSDLRGYIADQFRGDRRVTARAEYSVPLFKWNMFAFRALGFADVGTIGFHARDPDTRSYLPSQHDGASWTRSDVGGGFRVYVKNVVLPLLGLDLARGLEGKRSEVVFEVGITDF